MSRSEDFVTLRGGLTLPVEALRLAWDFEARGLELKLDGDILLVGPRELLTDADRVSIRKWKLHLLAMLTYDADGHEEVQ